MDNDTTSTPKCPQIGNLAKITPEQAAEYVRFVAHVRYMQRRYFVYREMKILEEGWRLEDDLDALNAELLDQQLKLF